jgi:hypothetical protein
VRENVPDRGIAIAPRSTVIAVQQSNQHGQEAGGGQCEVDPLSSRQAFAWNGFYGLSNDRFQLAVLPEALSGDASS